MSNQITTQTISFYGSDLITLKVEDVIYTAVKPIVEAMGLDWGGQQQKLSKSSDKFNCRDISMVAKDGKIRQMLCMPIKKLNGWLFSINPEKVRSDLKEKVICYQEECFEALYNYWHFGKAERKTTVDERTGLRNAVNMLVSKKGLIYSDAYNLVHHYMNVESIEDIPVEKLPMAVEYVHKICLEGELIIDVPKNTHTFELTEDELQSLSWAWFAFLRGIYTFRHIYPAFQRLGSNMAGEIYGQGFEYMTTARNAHKVINRLTQNFQYDYESNWRVLKHIRNFDPTFKQPTF
ncbi:antirepressor protein [Mannheimia varigena USDA-ARS-USMARC-1296]|uniref:Antirepressor protein n=1 Tax=Mannheimia varigena USDA-ARS-USMARC-1296 TaxID=1433287 RepID=W0QC82_9PAST|nr:phage antirepressor N-terminal domain-containing protein [Mannheimia varigena]AHG75445.1 antirepressor protein [Mannheimia varigena USDA-ARS-USMARC-1296]